MSLLLDALKKSEAQRRRGRAPTIDLTITSPSGGSRRPGIPWWIALLAVALLVAAAVWLWPWFAGWTERNQTVDAHSTSVADSAGAPASGPTEDVVSPPSELNQPPETPTQAAGAQRASQPAPVAGASNERRTARADDGPDARTDSAPMVGQQSARIEEAGVLAATRAGPTQPLPPARADRAGTGQVDQDGAAADAGDVEQGEMAEQATATEQAERSAQAERSEQADQEAARGRQPSRNFIRSWELPQAQRAEFPELMLTVHFFAEQPEDRFVLINGERYAEGQQVGTGVRLVEIRRRGAVVEFGSYRVLIE
ncbi:MAG: general secretion pathway protein GspB [Wenzhouxiangellaceae bacterium]